MGSVWMAQQTEPVKRLVAVKLIKPGMDSRQVIARFEAERQALALMDHPNIARVLDAGTTGGGRPYFVMDLVKGVPITRYCDDHHLTPRQRLELFIPVCQAVQHAHQKGIIHRDLKPSNVLVALYDGKPVPKIIDFGVAKAAGQQLTDKTLVTGFGAIVGTLEYMSPEQAELNQLDIDTRSDIYSLGVLLYELLDRQPAVFPQGAGKGRHAGNAAGDPRAGAVETEHEAEHGRRLADARRQPRDGTGEADQAGARRTRLDRDEGAGEGPQPPLRDRQRLRDGRRSATWRMKPVQACPPGAAYRLRKFVRRHKAPVLAGLLILLALLAGVVGTTYGLFRAEQQRKVVENQRNELAERNQALQAAREHERLLSERARQAIETVTSEASIDLLMREKDLRPEQKDFLDKMIQYYAEVSQDGGTTEQERTRQARAYYRMGRMNQILGRSRDSENAYRRAVSLRQQLADEFPTKTEYPDELARTHNALGSLLDHSGRLKEAESAYLEALAIWKKLAADVPGRPEFGQALAGIYNNLGNRLLLDTARLKEAEAAHAEALAIRQRLAAAFPGRPILRRALAMSHNNLGWLFQITNRPEKAEPAFRDAIAAQKQAVASFPDRPEFRLELASYLVNLGNLIRDKGLLKEAEAIYGEALPIEKHLVAVFPGRPQFREELATGHNNVGLLLRDQGLLKDAEEAQAEALAIQKRLAAEFPEVTEYRNAVAGTLFNLANLAGKRRDFAAARRFLDEALPHHQAAPEGQSATIGLPGLLSEQPA